MEEHRRDKYQTNIFREEFWMKHLQSQINNEGSPTNKKARNDYDHEFYDLVLFLPFVINFTWQIFF